MLGLDGQEHALVHDAERQGGTAGLAAHAEAFCSRVHEGLADADFDRKRALLELLIDRVIVTDGAVEIRYVVPTGSDGEREPFGDCEQTIEAANAWFKQVIGDALRMRTNERRATEVDIAVHALNRITELGRPNYVRVA